MTSLWLHHTTPVRRGSLSASNKLTERGVIPVARAGLAMPGIVNVMTSSKQWIRVLYIFLIAYVFHLAFIRNFLKPLNRLTQ